MAQVFDYSDGRVTNLVSKKDVPFYLRPDAFPKRERQTVVKIRRHGMIERLVIDGEVIDLPRLQNI